VELVSRVRQLVTELDHKELARREEAEKQLLELGPRVLPLLPPPDNRMPAEVRQRLLRVRNVLQVHAAQQTLQATRVTLEGEMTVAELIEAISRQTGNAFSEVPRGRTRHSVVWKEVPFWQAVDEVLDAAGLTVDLVGGQPHVLVLQSRPDGWSPRRERANYIGPFRLEPLRVMATRDLRDPSTGHLRVALQLSWEPRLAPLVVSYNFADIEAQDDTQQTLSSARATGEAEIPIHVGMSGVEWELPLALPNRSAQKIAMLRGRFTVLLPSQTEEFVFQDNWHQMRMVAQRKAAVVVTVEEVRRSGDLYQVRVLVQFDETAGALQSHRGWVFQNEAYLVAPDGQRIETLGMEVTRQDERRVGVSYLFDREEGLQGCKFVYKTPVMLVRQRWEYELRDLPLP